MFYISITAYRFYVLKNIMTEKMLVKFVKAHSSDKNIYILQKNCL